MPSPVSGREDHGPPEGRRRPTRIFIACAAADQDLLEKLEIHLNSLIRGGIIEVWHRGMQGAGEFKETGVREYLEKAEILIVLLSASLLASDLHHAELNHAMRRQADGQVKIVPVLVRAVNMALTPLKNFEVFPRDRPAVTLWDNQDQAWTQVVTEISSLIGVTRTSDGLAIPRLSVQFNWRKLQIKIVVGRRLGQARMTLSGEIVYGARDGALGLVPDGNTFAFSMLWIPALAGVLLAALLLHRGHSLQRSERRSSPNLDTPLHLGGVMEHRSDLGVTHQEQIRVFRGTVVGQETGAPVEGATVWLLGTRCVVKTDEFGAFTFHRCDDERIPLLVEPRVSIKLPGASRCECTEVPLMQAPQMTQISIHSELSIRSKRDGASPNKLACRARWLYSKRFTVDFATGSLMLPQPSPPQEQAYCPEVPLVLK